MDIASHSFDQGGKDLPPLTEPPPPTPTPIPIPISTPTASSSLFVDRNPGFNPSASVQQVPASAYRNGHQPFLPSSFFHPPLSEGLPLRNLPQDVTPPASIHAQDEPHPRSLRGFFTRSDELQLQSAMFTESALDDGNEPITRYECEPPIPPNHYASLRNHQSPLYLWDIHTARFIDPQATAPQQSFQSTQPQHVSTQDEYTETMPTHYEHEPHTQAAAPGHSVASLPPVSQYNGTSHRREPGINTSNLSTAQPNPLNRTVKHSAPVERTSSRPLSARINAYNSGTGSSVPDFHLNGTKKQEDANNTPLMSSGACPPLSSLNAEPVAPLFNFNRTNQEEGTEVGSATLSRANPTSHGSDRKYTTPLFHFNRMPEFKGRAASPPSLQAQSGACFEPSITPAAAVGFNGRNQEKVTKKRFLNFVGMQTPPAGPARDSCTSLFRFKAGSQKDPAVIPNQIRSGPSFSSKNKLSPLLNLPDPILAQIAAHVTGGHTCEEYALYPFQVVVNFSQYRALNPLRSTCRALRDASRLAISGLRCIRVAGEGAKHLCKGEMPLQTALSLPCLVYLHRVYGQGLKPLAAYVRGLRRVSILSEWDPEIRAEACRNLIFSSLHSLEYLHLSRVRLYAARPLLASLTGSLKTLRLDRFDVAGTPTLSDKAANSVKEVILFECLGIDDIFLQLLKSESLSVFTICQCSFAEPMFPEKLPPAVSLTKFELQTLGVNDAYPFEEAILEGGLENVVDFTYCAYPQENMEKMYPMLKVMCPRLRRLHLIMHHGLQSDFIEPLSTLPYHPDCELTLQLMSDLIEEPPESISVSPLLSLKNLVSLELSIRDSQITHLTELCLLSNLRSIHLEQCVLKRKNVITLAKRAKGLQSLSVLYCLHCIDKSEMKASTGSDVITLEDARMRRILPRVPP